MEDHWIPADEWQIIVANVLIVSVLVIRHDGGVLLSRRTDDPAKGYWFVPDGRVLRRESRQDVVHQVASKELGLEVEIAESLEVRTLLRHHRCLYCRFQAGNRELIRR